MRDPWKAATFVGVMVAAAIALLSLTGFAPVAQRQTYVTPDAMQPCCLDSGPLQCTGICSCPYGGYGQMLQCDDFTKETLAQSQVNWWSSTHDLRANQFTFGTLGGNIGCMTGANVSISDAGLDLFITPYDGGACPQTFDAGAMTVASYGGEYTTVRSFTPVAGKWMLVEQVVSIASSDTSNSTDSSGYIVVAPCLPKDGGPDSLYAAPYLNPAACDAGGPGTAVPEIDPWEVYAPGGGTPGSPGTGGPLLSNHSWFYAATNNINPLDYSGKFDATHTITEVIKPGVGADVYWDGVLKHSISDSRIGATTPGNYAMLLEARAWKNGAGITVRKDYTWKSIRICIVPVGVVSCN